MELKNINKIENLRNIELLDGKEKTFSKNTLIYAPNGYGKTNITRMLDSLNFNISERQDILKNLLSVEKSNTNEIPEFEIKFDEEIIRENDTFNGNILVFNSDYVDKNIRNELKKEKIEGNVTLEITAIGELNITLEEKAKVLKTKKEDKENKDKELNNNFLKAKAGKKDLIKKYDSSARSGKVEELFSIEESLEYEKNINIRDKNQSEYEKVETNIESLLEVKENFEKEVYLLSVNFNRIETLLTTEQIFEEPSDEIKDQIEKLTREVIEKVIKTHKESGKENCPVCLNTFTQKQKDLFKEYNDYLTSKKAGFESHLDECIKDLTHAKETRLSLNAGSVNEIKNYIISGRNALGLNLEYSELNEVGIDLDTLIKYLKDKKENPKMTKFIDFENIKANITKYDNFLTENNKSFTKIKDKVKGSVSPRKKQLRQLFATKLNIEFYESNKSLIESTLQLKKEINILEDEISNLKKQLPNSEKVGVIVKIFNKFLESFTIDKYELIEIDSSLSLKLNVQNKSIDISNDTNKISEGEKNILAFIYFLASSITKLENHQDFSNAIFVIDDPVCSLDYKYIHAVPGLISSFKEIIRKTIWNNKSDMSDPQIILFTHNIKFFNLMHANAWKNQENKKFELEVVNDIHSFSKCNKKISEYEKSILNLMRYSEGEYKFNIANDMRKVFEVISNMHGIKNEINEIRKVLGEENIPQEMCIFVNDGSHTDLDECSDISQNEKETKNMVNNLLCALKSKYPDLIKSLGKRVNN